MADDDRIEILAIPYHTDLRWKRVTCRDCGANYICTPWRDYFLSGNPIGGVCWHCLLKLKGVPDQPEPTPIDPDP